MQQEKQVEEESALDRMAELDDELLQILCIVKEKYSVLPRHLKIRTEKWANRLSEPTLNYIWKRDNIAYARILLQAVTSKHFDDAPFNKLPPCGKLPNIPRHTIKAMRNSNYNNTTPEHSLKVWKKIFNRFSEELVKHHQQKTELPTEEEKDGVELQSPPVPVQSEQSVNNTLNHSQATTRIDISDHPPKRIELRQEQPSKELKTDVLPRHLSSSAAHDDTTNSACSHDCHYSKLIPEKQISQTEFHNLAPPPPMLPNPHQLPYVELLVRYVNELKAELDDERTRNEKISADLTEQKRISSDQTQQLLFSKEKLKKLGQCYKKEQERLAGSYNSELEELKAMYRSQVTSLLRNRSTASRPYTTGSVYKSYSPDNWGAVKDFLGYIDQFQKQTKDLCDNNKTDVLRNTRKIEE